VDEELKNLLTIEKKNRELMHHGDMDKTRGKRRGVNLHDTKEAQIKYLTKLIV
jgi:hypothetical protein